MLTVTVCIFQINVITTYIPIQMDYSSDLILSANLVIVIVPLFSIMSNMLMKLLVWLISRWLDIIRKNFIPFSLVVMVFLMIFSS